MLTLTKAIDTFPSVRIPSHSGGLPVEVALIAQLGIGSGDQLIASASTRQRGHEAYIDALDEPSARIGGVDLAHVGLCFGDVEAPDEAVKKRVEAEDRASMELALRLDEEAFYRSVISGG